MATLNELKKIWITNFLPAVIRAKITRVFKESI